MDNQEVQKSTPTRKDKKVDHSNRIAILIVVLIILNQAELHADKIGPFLGGNEVLINIESFVVVYGSAVAGIWLLYEIAAAIDRRIKSKRKTSHKDESIGSNNVPIDKQVEERNHSSFSLHESSSSNKTHKYPQSKKFGNLFTTRVGLILLVVVIIIASFYWVSVRPVLTRKSCYKKAVEYSKSMYTRNDGSSYPIYSTSKYNLYYKQCLEKNGL